MDFKWEKLESKDLTILNSQSFDSNQLKLRLINTISPKIYKSIDNLIFTFPKNVKVIL
jgi:hypothetical protein